MFFFCVGAWAAKINDQNQWIQADLEAMHRILSVTTQGRYSRHNQWVSSYYVSYSQDGKRWEAISTPFEGNNDRDTKKTNLLPDNILAKYIRLSPISWSNHICMRFDVTGCVVPGTIMPFLLKSVKFLDIFLLSSYSSAHYEIWMISCKLRSNF